MIKQRSHACFFPKGTCNRGDSCPFSHEGRSAKAKPKAAAKGSATAKATVATLIATGASQGADAIKTNTSFVAETLRLALIPFKFALTMFVTLSNLLIPQDQRSFDDECLQPATSSSGTVSGVPAVVQRTSESACLATANWNAETTAIEWIADSGASRSLCSVRALQEQGLPEDVIQQSLQQEDTLKFQTGNGTTESTHSISIHGHQFGTHDHRVLEDCPIARSLAEIVDSGKPFIWMPNQLPYFVENVKDISVRCKGKTLVAERLDDGVPVFKEIIQLHSTASAFPVSSSSAPRPDKGKEPATGSSVPVRAPELADESEEEAGGREEELLRESMSLRHRLCHMPKNPFCETCRRARMYKRRTVRTRADPLTDRGMLPSVDAFGQRLASDFIVVSKTSDGANESYVQVIRDEYSGYLNAYPSSKHSAETVARHLLAFLGPYYHSTPMIVCKSDNAGEFSSACSTLGFTHEPTLAKRFPDNSTLEREIRTLEEITRSVHVGAGFHIYRDLWQHSVAYAAVVFNAFHPKEDADGVAHNRFELATGVPFLGQQLILGQLVYARKDRIDRHKFEASASPALFAGWRFDSGPKSFKGVCYVLDYDAIKRQSSGYQTASGVPLEEIYVPDGPPILPLKSAADRALTLFSEPTPEDIQPIEVPFSELPRDARAGERHGYITLDRLIKYGASPSCRACENLTGRHTPACRARFDGLIKADKIDTSKSNTKAKSIAPSTPAPEMPVPETPRGQPVEAEAAEDVLHPDDLPFSAGIPPGETDGRAFCS